MADRLAELIAVRPHGDSPLLNRIDHKKGPARGGGRGLVLKQSSKGEDLMTCLCIYTSANPVWIHARKAFGRLPWCQTPFTRFAATYFFICLKASIASLRLSARSTIGAANVLSASRRSRRNRTIAVLMVSPAELCHRCLYLRLIRYRQSAGFIAVVNLLPIYL